MLSAQVRAATVHLTIGNVRNGQGHVLVALCPRETFLQPHCAYQGRAVARQGSVSVTLNGVPAGIYAAQAFHDENDNGKLDRSFLGMPEEGLGFSRDAPMHFGPPDFSAASVTVGPDDADLRFSLRYY